MKLNAELLKILKNSPVAKALNSDQLDSMLKHSLTYKLREGEFLFHQGDPVRELFVCLSGHVKLLRLTPNGDEKIVDIIAPGSSFAEAVVFMGEQQYPVHAVALKKAEILSFDAAQYLNLLKSSNELCLYMMGVMSRRIHWLLNEVDRLTLHNATFRLVTYLLELHGQANSDSIHLRVPKHIHASRLSIKPETFSRILKRLSSEGLIRVKDQEITLLNVAGMEKMIQKES